MSRYTVVPSVYLIPLRAQKTVLGLRKNTPWMNGHYGMIAGHVEEGESPEEAIIREAFEEAGIILTPDELDLKLIMYRRHDRGNVDYFFVTHTWQGEIINNEPEKLGDWEWFDLHQVPDNTIGYLTVALNHIASNKPLAHLNYVA